MLDPAVYARIMASLNHEEGDMVPIWDFLDNKGIVDHIAPGYEDYKQAMVEVHRVLGLDLTRGYGVAFDKEQDGTVLSHAGIENARITGQSYWVTNYPIKNLDDLKNYKPEPMSEEHIREHVVPAFQQEVETFQPHTMYVPGGGCGFHATYGLMGQELFSYAIYDDPVSIERILEVETETCYRIAKATVEADLCPMYFIGDDIAYKGATLFSPDYLRKTFIKSLKRVCEPVKAAGQKVIFHSDGYVMEVLEDMIEAGIDGLNPIEPIAGMDIGLVKREYGKELVLVGNVDCSQVLPFGSVEDVVKATKDCLRDAGHGGGLFIGSSSEIVPATPVENIIAFYDACREWGRYPLDI